MSTTPIRRSLTCLALAAVLCTAGVARAADDNGGLPGDWLSEFSGARAIGLGGAYVARFHDPLGAVWNPAGITELGRNQIRAESMQLFEETSITSLGFAIPARRLPSVGFSMLALRSGEFERTNELNERLGSFQEGDTAFLITVAQRMSKRLSIGANLKFVNQSVEQFSATGFGIDLGLQSQLNRTVRVGMSLLNLGGPAISLRDEEDVFPVEARAGVNFAMLDGRANLAFEFDRREGLDPTLRGGTEFWINRSIALRAGYDHTSPAGGFTYRMPSGVDLDYGVSDHDLGIMHRFGVSYRFGGFFAQSVAQPEVFSPTGRSATTRFDLRSRTRGETTNWTLEVRDASGNVVRSFSGQQLPPQQITWDGKDDTGLPLPDGLYQYELVVRDDENEILSSRTRQIEILTEGPSGSVPVLIEKR
jgi:hypothetical protein